MKIRQGFVSNSSTASFLIRYSEFFPKDNKPVLTKAQVKKLEKRGYYKTYAYYPEQVNNDEIPDTVQNFNYGYHVLCNETDELQWLVKNNISFKADCHYGQFTLVFEKEWDHVLVLKNLGHCYLMHADDLDRMKTGLNIISINKDKFIKEGNYYI